ncbi:hypothetical protein HJG60_010693 [Phyllostomus discolor]|uniref:Uncharacterized protein n=1 Tax=Phyllostomus discolor TaxID=89673 RepID=A0A834ALU3_9CHIR|nr:hypothetical protein HJG60_010693 [Phyllostomus discolor]
MLDWRDRNCDLQRRLLLLLHLIFVEKNHLLCSKINALNKMKFPGETPGLQDHFWTTWIQLMNVRAKRNHSSCVFFFTEGEIKGQGIYMLWARDNTSYWQNQDQNQGTSLAVHSCLCPALWTMMQG